MTDAQQPTGRLTDDWAKRPTVEEIERRLQPLKQHDLDAAVRGDWPPEGTAA